MSHTPGPWNDGIYHATRLAGRTYAHIRAANELVPIAAVTLGVEGCSPEQGEANARLIAAAPDLLNALKAVLPMLEAVRMQVGFGKNQEARIAVAKAALAKAGAA